MIKTVRNAVSKNVVFFFWQRQLRNFDNFTLVARRRENFRVLGAIILGAQLPSQKCFSTQEFTRFLLTVSSQCRATRSDVSFRTK